VGSSEGLLGQYNLWLNIRYGEAPDETEDIGGAILVGDRERFEALTAESLRILAVVMCTLL
jgi:hypothetical protein